MNRCVRDDILNLGLKPRVVQLNDGHVTMKNASSDSRTEPGVTELVKQGMLANLLSVLQRKYNTLKTIDPEVRVLFVKRHFLRLLSILFRPLFLVLGMFLRIVLRVLKPFVHIRFGRLHSISLGIFATPTELYLCEKDAGIQPRHSVDIFYHYDRDRYRLKNPPKPKDAVTNQQLYSMFKPNLHVYQAAQALDHLNRLLPRGSEDFIVKLPSPYDERGLLDRFPPHIAFSEAEKERGFSGLRELGIEPDSPFVCFHAWDGVHIHKARPTIVSLYGDWGHDFGRYASIGNYLPAAEKLAGLGYYAIRMGKYVEGPIPSDNPRIIDYATHFRSDFMDVFLSAYCTFFIGQNSGITTLPMMFRRPMVFVNVHEFAEIFYCAYKNGIFIPRKYYAAKKGRLLTFREILTEPLIARCILQTTKPSPELYERIGLQVLENTPEEIAELALEMDQRLRGVFKTPEEDEELQRRFLSILRSYPDAFPPIKNYQRVREDYQRLRIGTHFLRTHTELLE